MVSPLRERRATVRDTFMIALDFDKTGGLIPAIAQDAETGEVLMLACINREAWETTLRTGTATYYSRSRRALWVKGETSGNIQKIKQIRVDCDNDTVLYIVEQVGGAACHTGHRSCFHRQVRGEALETIDSPVFDPGKVYKK
jgi:phosphoribosyl-AMP cyclohydrolase